MLPKTIKDAVDDEVFNFDIMLSNEISEHNVFNVILITIMKNDRYISQAIKCKFISEEELLFP